MGWKTFNENWIQCRAYQGWAHENCDIFYEHDLFYECEVCFTKKESKINALIFETNC